MLNSLMQSMWHKGFEHLIHRSWKEVAIFILLMNLLSFLILFLKSFSLLPFYFMAYLVTWNGSVKH